MVDEAPQEVEEELTEEMRQIRGLHDMMHGLFQGVDEITQAKTVVSFMGCLMAHSEDWKRLIPGFMEHMMVTANMVIAAHRKNLGLPLTEENEDGSSEEGSSEESNEESKPEGEAQG